MTNPAPLWLLIAGLALAACKDQSMPSSLHQSPSEALGSLATDTAVDNTDSGVIDSTWIVFFERDGSVPDAWGAAEAITAGIPGARVRYVYEAFHGFAGVLPATVAVGLRADPRVRLVSPNHRWGPYGHETQANAPWGLDRIDQQLLPLDGTFQYTHSGDGVTISIVDYGGNRNHSQFGGRDIETIYGSDNHDCGHHGTRVASIAAGNTFGVAKGDSVRIRLLTIGDCTAATPEAIVAIEWLTQNVEAPAVVNLSGGAQVCVGGPPAQPGGCDGGWACGSGGSCSSVKNSTLDDAVLSLVAAGASVVVAAGNSNQDACDGSPGRLSQVITVGATNASDQRWQASASEGSNYGTCVEIFAPGVDIMSAEFSGGASTITATSFSTPFVSGAAALDLQQDPGASPATVRNALILHSTYGQLSGLGQGSPNRLVLAGNKLNAGITGPQSVSAGSYQWQAHAWGGVGHYTYQWYRRDVSPQGPWEPLGTLNSQELSFPWGSLDFELRVEIEPGPQATAAQFYVEGDCEDELCPQSGGFQAPEGPQ